MPCNMCGTCCKAIVIPYSMDQVKDLKGDDAEFIAKNWTPITEEEALKINPYLKNWVEFKKANEFKSFFYTCNLLGKDNKCTVHDGGQPHTCTGYPFYNDKPNKGYLFYTESCGYQKEYKESMENDKQE